MTVATPDNLFNSILADRSLIEIKGSEAEHFLNNLITTNINKLKPGVMLPGALLSPQGKILFDFLIMPIVNSPIDKTLETTYLIDIASDLCDDFIKRLSLYKLRADIQITPLKPVLTYITAKVRISDQETFNSSLSIPEPALFNGVDERFPYNIQVTRQYFAKDKISINERDLAISENQWSKLRIAYAIPESGYDFTPGEIFPHDVNYDALQVIAQQKGCYIGQEVVSRMQHKAVIRKRLVKIIAKEALTSHNKEIIFNNKTIGKLGTINGNIGLAIVRIDKLPPHTHEEALVDNIAIKFEAPKYMPDMLDTQD